MAVNTTGRTYRDAGVDLDKAATVKERIKSLAARALGPGVVGGPGFFGGVFDPDPAGSMLLVASTDSVGTKVRIARALGRYDTLGHDIVNHCINDILPAGASPLFFLDYIGVGELEEDLVAGLVEGIADACANANCSLLGGETATLAGIYEAGDFDLVGFIVGAVDKDRLLTPDTTRPGDVLLGLPSSGLHTNGYSLVRSVFDIDDHPDVLASDRPGRRTHSWRGAAGPAPAVPGRTAARADPYKGAGAHNRRRFLQERAPLAGARPGGGDRRQHVVRAAIVPLHREPGRGDR